LKSERWEVLDRSGHGATELFRIVQDLSRCDLAYTWGGRISMGKFLWAARLLRKKRLVMLWSGSDVLLAQKELAAGIREPWIAEKVHWAVSPWVAQEVRDLGLPCEHVQTYMIQPVRDPKPLPRQFSVLLYVGDARRAELYGWDRMLEVARRFPDVAFHLCGLPAGQSLEGPANITMHRWMPDLTRLFVQTTVYFRPVRHDGLSFTVLEALSLGRDVLYSYPLTGCIQSTTVDSACQELEKLKARHESGNLSQNQTGMRHIADFYAPEIVRSNLFRRWEEI